jgi:crotonobetainyl-CoA:carnitine CoA-transferase CaiB-like acyl-CoA transferase
MQRVKGLIACADVMVHNFRPGVMDRLGLGWDAVQAINPRIVYAAVSGYGSEGPWRDKPGQDLLAQSLSGLPWLSGDADQGPVPAGVPVADILTGAHLVQGVLAALVRRGRTGKGGRVDVSLLESILDLQFEIFTAFLRTGKNPQRSAVNNAGVVSAAPYGIYATADGYLAIAMTPIDRLGELVDCDELAGFADRQTWFAQRDQIKTILKSHLATQTTAHWLARLEPADVWCAEVMDWERLVQTDGFQAVDMVQETRTSDAMTLRTTRCPVRIDGERIKSQRGAPRLGEHTDEVWQQHGAAK